MGDQILAFDDFWQKPAITEYHSFQQLKKYQWGPSGYVYVAFPWATLIDLLQTGREIPDHLIKGLNDMICQCRLAKDRSTLITVCQHIYAQGFSSIFKACHLNIVYWSHATLQNRVCDGIEWRPYPLFPVQRHSASRDGDYKALETRRYHASFVGAYEQKYYLSAIREEIFKLSEQHVDLNLLIRRRGGWHFQDDVYTQQIYGLKLEEAKRHQQDIHAAEYREVLMESMVSLCPSGSGPNSIRLWESLSYGCIPLVFADSLALPGEQQLWLEACVFMSESSSHQAIAEEIAFQTLEKSSEFKERQAAGQLLESRYGVDVFVWDLLQLERNRLQEGQAMPGVPECKPTIPVQQIRVLIIDPGLKTPGSHHHKINEQLAKTLGASQIFVFSHQLLNPADRSFSYPVKAVFSYGTYDDLPDLASADYCRQVETLTQQLLHEWRTFDGLHWLYVHTATPAQIQMIANCLELLRDQLQLTGVYLQLMFEPRSLLPKQSEFVLPRAAARYTSALNSLDQITRECGVPCFVETSNPAFQRIFKQLDLERSIGIHPHLFCHDAASISDRESSSGRRRVLLHSGDPRPGKGLEWMAREIEAWINDTPADIQFVIHIGKLRYPDAFPQIAEAIDRISSIAQCHPDRISLKRGYASDTEWVDMVQHTDALALLYDPEFYRYKTSGALLDYLQITKGSCPLLVSAQINSEDILHSYGINYLSIDYGDGYLFRQAIQDLWYLDLPKQAAGWQRLFSDFFATTNTQHLIHLMGGR
jgi:hypothetical protein